MTSANQPQVSAATFARLRSHALSMLQMPLIAALHAIQDFVWSGRGSASSPAEALELLGAEAGELLGIADDLETTLSALFPGYKPRPCKKVGYSINPDGTVSLLPPPTLAAAAPTSASPAATPAVTSPQPAAAAVSQASPVSPPLPTPPPATSQDAPGSTPAAEVITNAQPPTDSPAAAPTA